MLKSKMTEEQMVEKMSETQKKAVAKFLLTDNLYRYKDELHHYNEPFLWSDTRWTIESAPDSTLLSLYRAGVLQLHTSRYAGDFYFLTDKGYRILDLLIRNYDPILYPNPTIGANHVCTGHHVN
jgi:hypothetical protein